jgi:hypothetical protein
MGRDFELKQERIFALCLALPSGKETKTRKLGWSGTFNVGFLSLFYYFFTLKPTFHPEPTVKYEIKRAWRIPNQRRIPGTVKLADNCLLSRDVYTKLSRDSSR